MSATFGGGDGSLSESSSWSLPVVGQWEWLAAETLESSYLGARRDSRFPVVSMLLLNVFKTSCSGQWGNELWLPWISRPPCLLHPRLPSKAAWIIATLLKVD